MKKEINLLKELQKKHGDIKLGEVIKILEEKSIVKSIEDITIKCIKVYGKGCYELSGETRNERNNLKGFIFGLFDLHKPDEDEEGLYLPEDFIDYILGAILSDEFIGKSHKVHYENIELSHDISFEEAKEFLSKVIIDGESYDNLEERDYDDFFDM
jgi:hypothetical protein